MDVSPVYAPATGGATYELPRPVAPVVAYGLYPALAALGVVAAVAAVRGLVDRGAATGAFAGLVILITALAEWRVPLARRWRMTAHSFFRRDLPYLVVDFLVDRVGGILVAAVALSLVAGDGFGPLAGLPVILQAVAGLVLFDLCWYGYHRCAHRFERLWRVHGAHHSPAELYVFMHGVFHPFDAIVIRIVLTLAVFGFSGMSADAVAIALIVMALQTVLSHANLDLRTGPLAYLLVGPEVHRFHHSADHHGNYASVLTIWDHVFGTFVHHPRHVPARLGLADPTDYPDPEGFHQVVLWPFRS